MTSEEAHEWSRHYDSIQWTVTAILIATAGALLVQCTTSFDLLLAMVGTGLTLASVFFASSFRALRRRLNDFLDVHAAGDAAYLRSRAPFKQWPVHLVLHAGILAAWLRLLLKNCPEYRCGWWSLFVLGLMGMIVLGVLADHRWPEGTDGNKSA